MLKRFFSYYRPHKKMFTLDMISSLFVSLIGIVYPMVTRRMLNDLIPNKNYRMIVLFGLALLGLYLVRMFLRYFIQYQGHMVGVKMQAQMRSEMFDHLQKLPFSFYDGHETGRIMSRMTNDLMDLSELAHHGPENVIISTISIVTAFVYLSLIDIWLTLIIFVCVPVLAGVAMILRKRMREAFARRRQAEAVINGALESSISGIRVTKAFTNAETEKAKFEVGNAQFVEARRDSFRAMAQFSSSTAFITDVFNVIVLIAGGLFLYAGRITLADYSAFIVSIGMFINPVTTLINFMEQYQSGVTGFERFVEIMDVDEEKDRPSARDAGRLEGHIAFHDVTHGYEGGKDVITHMDLDVKKGMKYALVGPSGGGKTTICHLIPRFYDVTSGSITIDGTDIRDMTQESLRKNIGIVQQDIYLFNATIRENILYGRPGATQEEVVEAAKRANIHEYILSLPDGYDTQIGERGVKLSGGQKQRLSIARVFLKNPPVLILDEATSALDNTTEILIQQALDELCEGRTTIVVAHRLSTIRNADEIAVIDGGRIVEKGSHDELMEKDGVYASLYRLQFRVEAA